MRLEAEILREVINEQSNDDGLWFHAETAAEAYLQKKLRLIHAAAEALLNDMQGDEDEADRFGRS